MIGNMFLLVLCAAFCCVRCHSDGSSVDLHSVAELQDSVYNDVYNAHFGDEMCNSENCGRYEIVDSSAEYTNPEEPEESYEPHPESLYLYPDEEPEEAYEPHPESRYPDEQEEIYQPQYPDVEAQYPDQYEAEASNKVITITYPALREALETVSHVEHADPDVAPIIKVLDYLIKLASYFADIETDCDPAVKLLDSILAAAYNLRHEYEANSDASCESTETPVTTEATEYATSEKPDPSAKGSYETTVDSTSSEQTTKEPCQEHETGHAHTEQSKEPSTEESSTPGYGQQTEDQTEDIIAEEECDEHVWPPFVGSIRGIPGEHYPNYTDIPITSFSCADKKCIPGFYADLETGCQVFHVCYEHRRESFLCPIGTVFNQPILACDYWYSSNCSLAPSYYDINCKTEETADEHDSTETVTSVGDTQEQSTGEGGTVIKVKTIGKHEESAELPKATLDDILKFIPVKAKVTVFGKSDKDDKSVTQNVEEVVEDIFNNILTTATLVTSKARGVIAKIPEPIETDIKVQTKKPLPVLKSAAFPVLKLKADVPKAKFVGKMAAVKTAVPVAKFVAAKAAIPVAKTTLAVGKKLAVKATVPVVAGKAIAAKAAVPVATLAAAKAIPTVAKSKIVAGKAIASKAAFPVAAKAKLVVASKATVPAAKTVIAKKAIPAKFAAGKKIAFTGAVSAKLPVAKAAAIKGPALKANILAASLPFAKAAFLKSSFPVKAKVAPVFKAKLLTSAGIPIVKGKMMALPLAKSKLLPSVPLVKAKVAKAAAISPLTKKALALGYMKLLKAKKVALMG